MEMRSLNSTSSSNPSITTNPTRTHRTHRTHLTAWYTYAFAAEVFSACALAIFLPILLEQMAREVGFLGPDMVLPCQLPDQGGDGGGGGGGDGGDGGDGVLAGVCRVRVGGLWVDTASFSMYVKSLAVAIQALAIISVGPLADSRKWRKKLLITFAYTGALSGIALLLFPSRPETWTPLAAAGLTIVGNVGYAISIVCANAFLPDLAREEVDCGAVKGGGEEDEEGGQGGDEGLGEAEEVDEERALLPRMVDTGITAISTADLARTSFDDDEGGATRRYAQDGEQGVTALQAQSAFSMSMSRISSTGTALGFFSGVAVLALLTIPVTIGQGSTASLRLAIGLSGCWWAVFTLPAWIGLPAGDSEGMEGKSEGSSRRGFLVTAWTRVGRMIAPSQIRRLPNLFTFLLAWIFLSDGFHTTTYTAILYASSTLRMPASKIIIIGILVQLSAVASSLYTPRLQAHMGYSNIAVLLRVVVLALVLPVYTCVGLLLPFGGLRTEGEMYVAATWFGLLYGPFNSYSRAVYAELIPPGHESSFFSLFALTDKSASFLGPFVVGLIADLTGNIRLGFLFLLVMLLVPVPVLLRVSMTRGREEARVWVEG